MILSKEGLIPKWKFSSVNSPRDWEDLSTCVGTGTTLQNQNAKMPDLCHPQSLTRTTFKAHAHFSSQLLLTKLSVPHEYGIYSAFSRYKSRHSFISLTLFNSVQSWSQTAKLLCYFCRKRPAKMKSFDQEITSQYPATVKLLLSHNLSQFLKSCLIQWWTAIAGLRQADNVVVINSQVTKEHRKPCIPSNFTDKYFVNNRQKKYCVSKSFQEQQFLFSSRNWLHSRNFWAWCFPLCTELHPNIEILHFSRATSYFHSYLTSDFITEKNNSSLWHGYKTERMHIT